MIILTFDIKTGEWSFEGEGDTDLAFRFIDGSNDSVVFDHLAFGYTAFADGNVFAVEKFPPNNVVYRQATPNNLFRFSLTAPPDSQIVVAAWASNAGIRTESEVSFIMPRPAQPYQSWIWDGSNWQAPLPKPEDDENTYFFWDEENQEWATVSLIGEQGDD